MEQVAAIGRIPSDLYWNVAQFLQTPTAELIKTLKFTTYESRRYGESNQMWVNAPPGAIFTPKKRRLDWILQKNKRSRVQLFPDWEVDTLHMTFHPWKYETLEDMGYLASWVVEEFLEQGGQLSDEPTRSPAQQKNSS